MSSKPLPPTLPKKAGPPMKSLKPPMKSPLLMKNKGEGPMKNVTKPMTPGEKMSKILIDKNKMMAPPMKIQNSLTKKTSSSFVSIPSKVVPTSSINKIELKKEGNLHKEMIKSPNIEMKTPIDTSQINKEGMKAVSKAMSKLSSFIKKTPEPVFASDTFSTPSPVHLKENNHKAPSVKSNLSKPTMQHVSMAKESSNSGSIHIEKTIESNHPGEAMRHTNFQTSTNNRHHANNTTTTTTTMKSTTIVNSSNPVKEEEEGITGTNTMGIPRNVINNITVHNTNLDNNIMLGIVNDSRTVGPLSTFKDSELIRNNHYINAFSKMNGDYVGKVSGPPCPISVLDKIPQSNYGKRHTPSVSNTTVPNDSSLLGCQDVFRNFSGWYNHNGGTMSDPNMFKYLDSIKGMMPYCFYPGMCVPMFPCAPWEMYYNQNPNMHMMNMMNQEEEGESEKERNLTKKKKQKHKVLNDGKMIAAGHLKPLQYKYGTEWSSDFEKYINADIDLEQESSEESSIQKRKKEKRKKRIIQEREEDDEEEEGIEWEDEYISYNNYGRIKNPSNKDNKQVKNRNHQPSNKAYRKVRTIGNSPWYQIEHRLNNVRGEIETEDEEEGEDSAYDSSNYLEETEKNSDEEYAIWKRKQKKLKQTLKKQQQQQQQRNKHRKNNKEHEVVYDSEPTHYNTDEDSTTSTARDLYENYKVKYLKEKLQWANEYLKKKKKKEKQESRNQGIIEYSPLKKKHLKRIDDIANLFLPKNKKYQNLCDLAGNLSKISVSDQSDVINLLLSCRELEKTIEEQHCVLDMLDYDLKEVNSTLKLPPNWDLFENIDMLNDHIVNPDDKYLPSNNSPMFIKGRVTLVPKNIDTFFDEQEKTNMNKPISQQTGNGIKSNININNTQPLPMDTNIKMQKRVKFLPKINPKMKSNPPIFKNPNT